MKKLLSVFVILILEACSSITSHGPPNWIVSSSGCKVWNTNPVPNETVTWAGRCAEGYVDGIGTLQWYKNERLSNRIEGRYKEGNHIGEVKVIYPDGSIYVGFLGDNGSRQGYGRLTRPSGSVQEGFWNSGSFIDKNSNTSDDSSNLLQRLGRAGRAYQDGVKAVDGNRKMFDQNCYSDCISKYSLGLCQSKCSY